MSMETAVPALSNQAAQSASSPRGRRNRGQGRGRGRGQTRSDAPLSLRPASIVPHQSQNPDDSSATDRTSIQRKPASRSRQRGGGSRPQQNHTVNGRQFMGQLTHDDSTALPNASSSPSQLQANAPEFVFDGEPTVSTYVEPAKEPYKQHRPHKRRPSKSQASNIATRTHEDIDNGYYECAICTGEVIRKSKVWSCHTCWTVFHLSCIKRWSTNEGSAAAQQQAQSSDDLPTPRQWRCPGCNLPKDELPKQYICWCGKEIEPRAPTGIPPHSCGSTCGKERAKNCPHPCDLTCHAGPCPPCSYMGPTQLCFCGKHEVTKRCSETDYDSGWSCGELCGESLSCGEHICDRPCHSGLCGACDVLVPARCFCGQVEKNIVCGELRDKSESHRANCGKDGNIIMESWTGSFDCGSACGRPFDCGIHHCERRCHPGQAMPEHCPRSPDVVSRCSCEKTELSELSDIPRKACIDPVPSCNQPCDKLLPCGHRCKVRCHTGPCASCMEIVDIKCRCGRTESRSICHQGKEELPQCMRVCRTMLNCGRHACEERCCTGQAKATERQSTKRKQRPLNSTARAIDEGIEAEHICTRECGRLLKCGTHTCHDLCHKGQCGTCREAVFQEISCNCGRTVLQPPLPCGTKPPPCRYRCTKPKSCGHPQVVHNCHEDDQPCPNCPYLVEKRCMCGKKTLKNQKCWLQDVSCGVPCGKTLKCGSHACRKLCHRVGECEDAHGERCAQPCMKEKTICAHPHTEETCHAPFPCKEDKPCQSKIYITCACQVQKQEMKCGASKNNEGNAGKSLPCNEECARLERNRKLALALNIDQTTHVDGGDHIPYSMETLNLFAENMKWAQTQEREFRVFASSDEEKRLRFPPMKQQQRALIHALADDFGLDSESMDPEPHRHVMIWKTPRFVSAPNKTLADALRIRRAQRSATASTNVSDTEDAVKRTVRIGQALELYNAFIINHVRFGLTVDELRAALTTVLHPSTPITFEIEFLQTEEVIIKAVTQTLSSKDLDQTLKSLRTPIATAIASKGYGSAQLCVIDHSLRVLRRESDNPSGDGWSRVAAKKAAPKIAVHDSSSLSASTNGFAALTGSKVTLTTATKKKSDKLKARKQSVVDDWEAAELAEEEKERVASEGSGEEDAGGPANVTGETAVESSVLPVANESEAKSSSAVLPPQSNDLSVAEKHDWASQVE